MGVLETVGRVCLAAMFVQGGAQALSNPGKRAELVERAGLPEPELAVRLNGAVMVGAGAMLALGVAPRLAAGALAASLVPTTLVGHAFWQKEGGERQGQQLHFLKNLAMFGGLLVVAGAPRRRLS